MRQLFVRTLGLTVLLAGCGASSKDIAAVSALTGDATSGQSLYAQNCQSCHGADAASGTAKRPVASLASSSPDTVISTVLSGEDEMPSFSGTLTNQQIADIVAYLKTL